MLNEVNHHKVKYHIVSLTWWTEKLKNKEEMVGKKSDAERWKNRLENDVDKTEGEKGTENYPHMLHASAIPQSEYHYSVLQTYINNFENNFENK